MYLKKALPLFTVLVLTFVSGCNSSRSIHLAESSSKQLNNTINNQSNSVMTQSYIETEGLVVIEAENFASQQLADKRAWHIFSKNQQPNIDFADPDLPHIEGASGGSYIENLPDTRTNHHELLIEGENFSPRAGKMALLSYPVYFTQPGRYYVWARAYSTGPEDNGFHLGLDGVWQTSSQRLQFCADKYKWTWSSQQRREKNHCGDPLTLWIDVETAGQHVLMLSMREDGAELDKIILTKQSDFIPQGIGPTETLYQLPEYAVKKQYLGITNYQRILTATKDFQALPINKTEHSANYYHDKKNDVLAINAAKADLRQKFAKATFQVDWAKTEKTFNAKLVTLSELDGESQYKVLLNNKVIAEFTNPETESDYSENIVDIGLITLKPGDELSVLSNSVTNGKIPEGEITAYSRGRWRGIVLQKPNEM